MKEERVSAGPFRNALAKLTDALVAVLTVATVVQGLTRGPVLVLILRFREWVGWVPLMNMVLQFSFYMHNKAQTIGDAMLGIEVIREKEKTSWPSEVSTRVVVSSIMFNPRWPPTIFVIALWVMAIVSLATGKGGNKGRLPWEIGTRGVIVIRE